MSEDELLDAAVDALPAVAPPPGFADRVLRARAPRRRRWPLLGLAAAAALGAFFWAPWRAVPMGERFARSRTSVELLAGVTAVLEPAARIAWRGREVTQGAGSVFYRVDGGAFVVRTPAGEVRTLGTCFEVEVSQMKSQLKSAAAGAALTAAVLVTVYEGRVELKNAHGRIEVAPGEAARAESGGAPAPYLRSPRVPRVALPTLPSIEIPEAPTPSSMAGQKVTLAAAGAGEVDALRAEVARLEAALEAERAMRTQTEGDPVDFPRGLDERYREAELLRAFRAGFAELGRDFEIQSVDCTEYPCIVYGDVENEDNKALEALTETDAMRAYRDGSNSTSAWGRRTRSEGEEVRRTFFGVALYPDEDDPARREQIGKRLRFRTQQGAEAMGR